MATYAVGDVQGCLAPLKCLLKTVTFNPACDQLWVAGDLINRGPASLETLRFIKKLGKSAVVVLGNHDLHLMAVAYNYRESADGDTLNAVLQAPDKQALLNWLRKQKIMHYDPVLKFSMVHAGIPPLWGLKKALCLAAELEAVIRSDKLFRFLPEMYGDQPDTWNKDLEKIPRWRLIANYFTRMRFCDPTGKLELRCKSGPASAPPGYSPWFAHPHRKMRKDKLIFGHWAALEGNIKQPNLYPLDTGCVWGGNLTMMRLEDERYFTCKCHK